MTYTHLADSRVELSSLIRNEPVQARSAARLMALLDAAAQVVDEIGYERLTTAMVADRAGASIGTVYRYFPDRIAVLQSLATRNAERVSEKLLAAIDAPAADSWESVWGAVFDAYVDAFRTEAGFASLRFGDVIDLRPRTGSPANAIIAETLYSAFTRRFGLVEGEESRLALEAAVEVTDALVARAFSHDGEGYEPFIEHGRRAAAALIAPHVA